MYGNKREQVKKKKNTEKRDDNVWESAEITQIGLIDRLPTYVCTNDKP